MAALREQKKFVFYLVPSPSSSLSSTSNSRVSITLDRNGFKEHQLYQSL